ncbi:MAG: OsmC family protein [Caulobacterales bacterium]
MNETGRTIARAEASIGAVAYETTITSGKHVIISDEPESGGGKDAGAAPFGLLLASLGACTAMTLKMYAERKQWPLENVGVALRYYKDGDAAKIDRILSIAGALDETKIARLADIAERTPVTLAIKNGLPIETSVQPK